MGARRRAPASPGFDYALIDALHPSGPYAPDFVAPPPLTPLPDVEEELARVRATPPERVRLELGWTFEGREVPAVARPLLDDPARELAALVDLMAELLGARDRAVVGPDPGGAGGRHPPARRATSRAAARSSCSRACTPTCAGTTARCSSIARHEAEVELAGRGLQLVPVGVRVAARSARCSTRRGSRR